VDRGVSRILQDFMGLLFVNSSTEDHLALALVLQLAPFSVFSSLAFTPSIDLPVSMYSHVFIVYVYVFLSVWVICVDPAF
jgi:hypothetical protein